MPRHQKPTAPQAPALDADILVQLTDALRECSGHLEMVWRTLEDIRSELQWAVRNDRLSPHVVQVTRMALDPLAEDWEEKLSSAPVGPDTAAEKKAADSTGGCSVPPAVRPALEAESTGKMPEQKSLW